MASDPRLAATLPVDPTPALATDDTVAAPGVSPRSVSPATRLARGSALGRYVVLGLLGEGGMGAVYKAYDPDLDRRLAVKLLHAGALDGRATEGRARLEREAQAMARLSHPNVVAIYDVGRYDGQVFIAMELVEGETLRAWLATPRSVKDIVAIFIQAGRGLAAAHEAGIVHRDFKGDNVLVGADGRARVVDFGLAHSAGAVVRGADSVVETQYAGRTTTSLDTPLTQDGALLGTPRYMAPEQLTGDRTDAAADQFSFSVALYEALYGQPPFEGEDLMSLSSNVLSGRLRALPAGRKVASWLRPIVARGLSRKPTDRFPSMNALIDALGRDPADVRRRAWTIAGTAVGAAIVAAGLFELRAHRPVLCPSAAPEEAAVWGEPQKSAALAAFRATGKPFAEDAFQGSSRALDDYGRAWVAMHDDACAATRARGSQSPELMDLRMSCLERRLAGMQALTERFSHADATTVERAVVASRALEPLEGCGDAVALRAPGLPADPAARKRIDEVRARVAATVAVARATKPADALAPAEAALAAAKDVAYRPLEAEALEGLGTVLDLQGDFKRAISTLGDAVLAAEAGRHESVETQAWIDLVHAEAKDQRNPDAREAAKHARALLDRDGPSHEPREATFLVNEALVAYNEGHYQEAIDDGTRALAIREKLLPPDHPDIAECLNQLGNVSLDKEDLQASLDYHRRALAIREKALGPSHPLVAISLNNLGNALSEHGDMAEAVASYKRALDIKIGAFGEESLTVANTLGTLGLSYTLQGKEREAIDAMERALAIRLKLLGPDHIEVAKNYGMLAEPQFALHRYDEAIDSATKSIEIEEKDLGKDAPMLASSLTMLAEALLGKGDAAGAIPVLERALKLGAAREGSPGRLAGTKEYLALALRATHRDPARVRQLVAEARATFESLGGAQVATELERLDKEFPPR